MKKTKIKNSSFSIPSRLKSFQFAFAGILVLFREEHNAWIHLLATFITVTGGFYFNISRYEWIALFFAIGIVFVAEIVNTSIENLSDVVSPERSDSIKKVKDLAAAAVLFSAIIAMLIGALIFIPKF